MAGHSHAKNVMHRKAAQNKKRSKIITKLAHAISTAIKVGGSTDPEINSKLRLALKQAQQASVPKDVIKRAIESSNKDDKIMEEIMYEGYISGVAVLIETLTDNKNKTAPEIRAAFNKYGGSISQPNAVAFSFDKVALIELEIAQDEFDIFFEYAIENDAIDVEEFESENADKIFVQAKFKPEDLHKGQEAIDKKWEIENAQLAYIPQNMIELDEEAKKTFEKMLEIIEENESTQNIWHNLKT